MVFVNTLKILSSFKCRSLVDSLVAVSNSYVGLWWVRVRVFSLNYRRVIASLTLSLRSALRLWLGHFEWPVTVMSNAWKTTESRWNLPKLLPPLSPLLLSMTHAKPPYSALRQGPGSRLQTRRLCLASWQISEALTYPKWALTHMWPQCCVCWALTQVWLTAKPKKHGHPSTRDLFLWQNQEIPLIPPDINHSTLFKYLFLFHPTVLWMRTAFHPANEEVLVDASEVLPAKGFHDYHIVWTGVRDQCHSDRCCLGYCLPKHISANPSTA